MFNRSLLLLSVSTLAIVGAPAHAASVTINFDESLTSQLGLDADAMRNDLAGEVDGQLNLGDQATYLTQMANAANMSTKGLGVDYASNPKRFVIGGGLGTAVNGGGAGFGKGDGIMPQNGFAFQASIMAGLNLGIASDDDSFARRITIYGNWMAAEGEQEPFSGSFNNLGAHLQFSLIKPVDAKALEWGGIAFTTGYEKSDYRLTLSQGLPLDSGDITWDADGQYDITADTSSIPLELSTNVRVLLFSIYGGGGMDVNLGSAASSVISLAGPINTELAGDSTQIGTALVEVGERGKTNGYTPRFFGGVQLNVMFVKVYGHLNVGLDESFGGHLGARIAL